MKRLQLPALLLSATALTITPASAQDQDNACADLQDLLQQAEADGFDLVERFRDAPAVAEANVEEECALYIAEIDRSGGVTAEAQAEAQASGQAVETETETFTERQRLTETVEIEQQAVVQGKVLVRSTVPEVEVKQKSADIEIRETPLDVEIDEQPASILVRQQPATVRVNVPRPTITVEQPAPEIIVTMPPPGVNVNRDEPQISVRMPDPEITVAQADPTVDVQVEARFVEPGEVENMPEDQRPQVVTQTERRDSQGNMVADANSDVSVSKEKANVRFITTNEDNEVRYNRARPQVTYERAEPNVEISYADEPRVQVQQSGEPTVRFRRGGQDQQSGQQQGNQQQGGQQEGSQQGGSQQGNMQQGGQQQGDQQQASMQQSDGRSTETVSREALTSFVESDQQDDASGAATRNSDATQGRASLTQDERNRMLGQPAGGNYEVSSLTMVTVGDVDGLDVMTMNGDEVGEIERIVENDGRAFAIIEHGGFLGIGDTEVAIPVQRLAMRGGEVLLLGLTEQELEMMPEYDFQNEVILSNNDPLEIGLYE